MTDVLGAKNILEENMGLKMIISEKQIMQLITLFRFAIEDDLTPSGKKEAEELLMVIEKQQSEELKVIE